MVQERLILGIEAVEGWGNWTNRRLAGEAIYLIETGLVEATGGSGDVVRGMDIVYDNWRKYTANGQKRLEFKSHDLVNRFDRSTKSLEGLNPGGVFEHKLISVNYKASLIFSRDSEGVFSVALVTPKDGV